MRVRRIINDDNKKRVVWFGSYGKNEDGTAKFFNSANKQDNFASDVEFIENALTQKLSVIRKELWYDYQYGMPLTEKNSTKVMIDAFVMETVQSHEGVLDILEFTSRVIKNDYFCDILFNTEYGSVRISL